MAHAKLMMRILLSSPSDTKNEREMISKIVDEINEANKETPYGIELYRWETDTDPEIILDNGQKLIDKTFDYNHADMLIGIFFKRAGKWTEYEIDQAISVKEKYGFPHIKLYFKKTNVSSVDAKTLKDFKGILQLEEKYKNKGITGVLKGSKDSIVSQLRKHLTRAFDEFKKANAKTNIFIPEINDIIINPYKLFYYRNGVKKLTLQQLSLATSISVRTIKKYESVEYSLNNQKSYARCSYKNLHKLELALGLKTGELCVGRIEEDFVKCYEYYKSNYNNNPTTKTGKNSGRVKVVVFDFDGTLVDPHALKTTWQQLWTKLDYNVSICNELHSRFDNKEISHQEWCDLTADYFIKKGMSKQILEEVATTIQKMPGLHDTISELSKLGIKLYIVSGSIKELIYMVLKEDANYFEEISANSFIFDENGLLTKIEGTDFDFEGKAKYVKNISRKLDIPTKEILFIGNSFNDAHVYKSGAQTLCVNATRTNSHNRKYWHKSIDEMKNLSEIVPHCTKNKADSKNK